MIRAIRCELTRLKNPSFILGGVGLMTLFGVMATLIVFLTAGDGSTAGAPGPPGTKGVTIKALEASNGMFAGVQNIGGMLGIVALMIWAIFVTSDYSSGLIRLLVKAEPSRLRLLGGKVVTLTAFTCVATLVTTVVVLVVSPGVASLAGVSTDAWSSGLLHTVLTGYIDLTLSVLLWGVVGLFVGMVTRSTGISIGVGIGCLLVFKGLVSMVLDSADMTYGTALLAAAAYAAAAIAVSAITFRRRDITA